MNLLAEKFGYLPSRLAQKFKTEIGCSIQQYIKEKRINLAKQMLHATQKSVQANPMAHSMTFAMMAKFSGGMIPEAALQALDGKLKAL